MATDKGSQLVSIGQLAKSARCSVKALRLYAEQGLLQPARVDPSSGYRYYRRSQARDALTIAMLRSLGMSLAAISELLSQEPARVAATLAAERERLEREISERHAALSAVERLLDEDDLMPYAISIEQLPALEVCSMRVVVAAAEQEQATTHAVRQLQAWARAHHLPQDPLLCLVQPTKAGELELQVALGLADDSAGVLQLPEGARRQKLDAGAAAVTTHVGSYSQLGLAHHALFAWIHERGHRELGPVREVYLDDPAQTPARQLRTRVVVPIDPS